MCGYISLRDLAGMMAAMMAILAIIAIIPLGLEREDHRVCLQAESWVQNNGAPETAVPLYCYEQGYLERK